MAQFEINDFTFYYPGINTPALESINLTVNDGDFIVLCGASGSGKSTLLKMLKPALTPHGRTERTVLFEGKPIDKLSIEEQTASIGFVMQSVENQIVTDKVWHELAFGLESLGISTPVIRRRVAEMAAFFGISDWFHKNVAELSGGQKQLLNLASVTVMQPKVLLLDEPTSQLDPIASAEFLNILSKINRELGVTVILAEHRLEEALPLTEKIAVMDKGKIICFDDTRHFCEQIRSKEDRILGFLPTPSRVWAGLNTNLPCPLTVTEGRDFLTEYTKAVIPTPVPKKEYFVGTDTVLIAKEVSFRYEKNLPFVVNGLNIDIKKGEWYSLLGGNGAGKTTTLKLLCGINKPNTGKIESDGKITLLPQNPKGLFVKKTVREDLTDVCTFRRLSEKETAEEMSRVISLCRLTELLDRHPFDLSGGEQQRLGLAKVLLTAPDILLLDEPTKGMDNEFKMIFAGILNALKGIGITIITVSHDVEFCASYSDRIGMFFDGAVVCEDTPDKFFSDNRFYTTSAARMAKGIIPNAITAEDILISLNGKVPTLPDIPKITKYQKPTDDDKPKGIHKLPLWRKISAAFFGVMSLGIMLYAINFTDLTAAVNSAGLTEIGFKQLILYGLFSVFALLCGLSVGKGKTNVTEIETPREKRKLTRRTAVACVLILLFIPITLFIGVVYLGDRQYGIISLAVLFECMLPFFLIFEGRKPKARELVIISVLSALGVAGRAAFFMLPQFKPVMAITIIAGVAFGGESGFLVGAVTMLASNVMFSQGPWTPFQMFAMGIVGFLSGVLFKKGFLRKTRSSLCVFGVLSAIIIYGGIMNPSTLTWGNSIINAKTLLTCFVTGFPMDCIHAVATALFLFLIAESCLEKLERVKLKYGLL